MKRILLVDDEPRVLQGLARQLRPLRRSWEVEVAGDGVTALETLPRFEPDVVLSDMMMPGMDGAELLRRVRADHPSVIRMVLSGQMGEGSILRAVSVAHRTLTKPCPAEELRGILERVERLSSLLPAATAGAALPSLDRLPVTPDGYELLRGVNTGETGQRSLEALALADPTVGATMLHLANLGTAAAHGPVLSIEDAVDVVGAESLGRLIEEHDFFHLDEHSPPEAVAAQQAGRRAAKLARAIAGPDLGPAAHAAALLKDFGLHLFARRYPGRFRSLLQRCEARPSACPSQQQEALGCAGPQLGAYLLGVWGLPPSLVSAVELHREPGPAEGEPDPVLAAVHAATVTAEEVDGPVAGNCARLALDPTIARHLDANEHQERWRQSLHESMEGGPYVQPSIA